MIIHDYSGVRPMPVEENGNCLHPARFGLKPGISTRAQMTSGLNSMFAACIGDNATAVIDGNDDAYACNGPISWPWNEPRIRCAGRAGVRFDFDENDYNGVPAFSVGPGDPPGQEVNSLGGFVGGFSIVGPDGVPPQNGGLGFRPYGTGECTFWDIDVAGFDIGIEPAGNCYLSTAINVGASFSKCNVGWHILDSLQNGDDWTYVNIVTSGRVAGMWVAGNTRGHNFFGGQVAGAAHGALFDGREGAVVFGRNYRTGVDITVAGGGLNFKGTNFEGTKGGIPIFKCYRNPNVLTADNAFFMGQATQSGAPSRVLHCLTRIAGGFVFKGCTITRNWTAADLVFGEGTDDGRFLLKEGDWKNTEDVIINAGNRTIASGAFTTMVAEQWYSGLTPSVLGIGDYLLLSRSVRYQRRLMDIAGAGDPEGAVVGFTGSRYARSDGGTGENLYIRRGAANAYGNTGWVAIG